MNPFSNISAVRQGGSTFRIFLCDDQRNLRELMKDCLDEIFQGHSIEQGIDGRQMVEAARTNVYDLILLDIDMPELDGFQALRAIREDSLNQDSIVVLLTGRGASEDILLGAELGATGYITKPFDFDTVAECLGELYQDRARWGNHLVAGAVYGGRCVAV